MRRILLSILLFAAATGCAYAQGKEIKQITLPNIQTDLAPGEGRDKVSTLCNICHSTDYIAMQAKSSRAQWVSAVNKMRKVFGAPISDADADVIIRYLAEHYGNGK